MSGPNRAAVLTPAGRAALATILFEGDVATLDEGRSPLFTAKNGQPLSHQPLQRIRYGHWGGELVEEVVLCRITPHRCEIHCHGGRAAVQRILADLRQQDVEIVPWTELLLDDEGVLAIEWQEALSRTVTRRTANLLLEHPASLLEQYSLQCLEQLHRGELSSAKERLDRLLRWAGFGRHLSESWEVVIAGRPNVGKSRLINSLLGFSRAIVFDQPGTTRDLLTAVTAFDGWPVRLTDTAGLRDSPGALESEGIARARKAAAHADLQILVLDASTPPTDQDRRLLTEHPQALILSNKTDLPPQWSDLPQMAVPISCKTGEGVRELAQQIANRLVPALPPTGTPIPINHRQIELLTAARQHLPDEPAAARRSVEKLLGRYSSPAP